MERFSVDVKVIVSFYSIGFLVGTYSHVQSILLNGFFTLSKNAPLLFNIYWDSLALFDPLAALLIWIKPKVGICLAILIMVSDISVNIYSYTNGFFGKPIAGMIPMWLFQQSLFATYVFVTAPLLAEKLKNRLLV